MAASGGSDKTCTSGSPEAASLMSFNDANVTGILRGWKGAVFLSTGAQSGRDAVPLTDERVRTQMAELITVVPPCVGTHMSYSW